MSNLVSRAIKEPNRLYLLSHEGHKGSQWTQCYGDLVYHNNKRIWNEVLTLLR